MALKKLKNLRLLHLSQFNLASIGDWWTNLENLEEMSFGVGYAFAQDNLCILADQIIKYNSERSKYLGPDRNPGSGDSEHLINDFGFLTVGIRELAEQNLATLSDNSRAKLLSH